MKAESSEQAAACSSYKSAQVPFTHLSSLDHQRAEVQFWNYIFTKHWVRWCIIIIFLNKMKHCSEDFAADYLFWTFMSYYHWSKKSGKIKTAYKREYVHAGLDVDLDFAGPTIHGAAVAGYEGWLAGYQMTIDSAKSKMTHSNFAVGYKTGDFQLHTNMYV